jgi:tetratricopeptide (TPR) repeat protein
MNTGYCIETSSRGTSCSIKMVDVLGTPSYMAPEQAADEHAKLGKATDVYGLGAVLYQLLTGHPPFAGGTTYETIRLLLDTEPRQPRLWNRNVDREVSTICLKCLEKDPKRRYSSALALAEDLEHWLKHEPIHAKRSGLFTHARKWVQRNPAIAALIASLAALAAAMGWSVWESGLFRAAPEKSIAVLPFENLSRDPDNVYFADGMQDEIRTNLARVADLKVIGRTSVTLLSYVDAMSHLSLFNLESTDALREEARQAAETALTLQPDLGEAMLAKGYYHYAFLKDYDTAVSYFERARPLLPNSSRIPAALAYVARRQGQWDEATPISTKPSGWIRET